MDTSFGIYIVRINPDCFVGKKKVKSFGRKTYKMADFADDAHQFYDKQEALKVARQFSGEAIELGAIRVVPFSEEKKDD